MISLVHSLSEFLGVHHLVVWFVLVCALIYLYGTWTYSTFTNLGLPGPKPLPLLGNFLILVKEGFRADIRLTKQFGRLFGYFEGVVPILIVAEPEYIKQITVKDFDHFTDRRTFLGNKELKKSIVLLKGEEWKTIRNSITPSFNGGKNEMAETIDGCAMKLVGNLKKLADSNDVVEIRHVVGTFTMDVVAETLFSIKIDSQSDYNNEFVRKAKNAFDEFTLGRPAILLNFFFPKLKFIVDMLGLGTLSQDSLTFFFAKVKDILQMRRGLVDKPHDMLQLLLDTKGDESGKGEEDEKHVTLLEETTENKKWKSARRALTEEEIVSNSMLFFLVGYETTATTVAWMLYNLALYPDVQEKLYREVERILEKHKTPDYEAISKMTYLDQVFCETLRLYPAANRTDRVCREDTDLGPYHIPKGMIVNISIVGVHHSDEFWSDPETFDPERFSPENRTSIVPYSFLPFGAGPRSCIGMRLATVEAKIAMTRIVEHFKIKRCTKTEVPIKIRNIMITIPVNGIWVQLERRH